MESDSHFESPVKSKPLPIQRSECSQVRESYDRSLRLKNKALQSELIALKRQIIKMDEVHKRSSNQL